MMGNGATSADAKSGDGRASRDGGRDHAMSRGVMSCDGATSVGKGSNGRTMTGGMTSGAATTTLGAVVASSEGTLSHNCPLSDGATSHGEASNGRIMTGGMMSGAATTIGAEASARATGTIGARIGTTIPGATMTGATSAARGSLSTTTAGGVRRCVVRDRAKIGTPLLPVVSSMLSSSAATSQMLAALTHCSPSLLPTARA